MATIPRGYLSRWALVPGSQRRVGTPGYTKLTPGTWERELYPDPSYKPFGRGGYSAPQINLPSYPGSVAGNTPEYKLPDYNAPSYDYGKVKKYREEEMRPLTRQIRSSLNKTMLGISPAFGRGTYASAVARKKLLAGAGSAYERAAVAARKNAEARYLPQYRAAADEAQAVYGAGVQRAANLYSGGLRNQMLERQMALNRWQTEANIAIARAKMEHDARMAEIKAGLSYY